MNPPGRRLPSSLVAVAALMVLLETVWFASQRPDYSHVANTISELGETGAVNARLVAFGFFLPVGLLVWVALWLVHLEVRDKEASVALVCMSCLGTGYAIAAFFPCDPGGPLFGSWQTQVHNVAGFIDYAGTGIGFLIVARYFENRTERGWVVGCLLAGALLFVGLAFLSMQATFYLRGAVQRVTEVVQFGGVFWVCGAMGKWRVRSAIEN